MTPPVHELLRADGWKVAIEPFWEAAPCFYDLGTVKTVILFKHGQPSERDYLIEYYWKLGAHELPDYVDHHLVELRRYKLHHSMNALLWHDHGDRTLWPE